MKNIIDVNDANGELLEVVDGEDVNKILMRVAQLKPQNIPWITNKE